MRISLSTLRKIIRESVNESESAPLPLDHYNLHKAIKSAGIHINDSWGGDSRHEGISIHPNTDGKLHIIIPDNVKGSKSADAAVLKDQISDLLMSKFKCELVPEREIRDLGTLYLVVAPDDEQTYPQERGHYHF